MVGLLLVGVAIALAARRFGQRHVGQVDLLKSLGASSTKVRQIYAIQLIALGAIAAVIGLIIGQTRQAVIASAVASVLPVHLPGASYTSYLSGIITGGDCPGCFGASPLWHLPVIPPPKNLHLDRPI